MLPNCHKTFQTGMPRAQQARQCNSNFGYLVAFAVANKMSISFSLTGRNKGDE